MKGDARQAVQDLIYSIRDVFKKYDKGSRTKAWKSVQSCPGKGLVDELLTNPSKPLVGLPRLLHFKEWLAIQK
jgi:hypothetical protein